MFVIATPTQDGTFVEKYLLGIIETTKACEKSGVDFNYMSLSGDNFVDRARNRLVSVFLQGGADKLLFIDADLGFTAQDVAKIVSHDVDIVGGIYPKKQAALDWPCDLTGEAEGDLLEALMIPTGFMCIHRRVFEAIEADVYTVFDEEVLEYFISGRVGNRYKGEDVAFCERVREHGFDLWLDPSVCLTHHGNHEYNAKFGVKNG
jgi:hypothetical protein